MWRMCWRAIRVPNSPARRLERGEARRRDLAFDPRSELACEPLPGSRRYVSRAPGVRPAFRTRRRALSKRARSSRRTRTPGVRSSFRTRLARSVEQGTVHWLDWLAFDPRSELGLRGGWSSLSASPILAFDPRSELACEAAQAQWIGLILHTGVRSASRTRLRASDVGGEIHGASAGVRSAFRTRLRGAAVPFHRAGSATGVRSAFRTRLRGQVLCRHSPHGDLAFVPRSELACERQHEHDGGPRSPLAFVPRFELACES